MGRVTPFRAECRFSVQGRLPPPSLVIRCTVTWMMLNAALSKVSVQFLSSLCRKMNSNRCFRKCVTRPSRRCLFDFPQIIRKVNFNRHFRRCLTRPSRSCLLNFPRACAVKWIPTNEIKTPCRRCPEDTAEPEKSLGSSEAEKLSILSLF